MKLPSNMKKGHIDIKKSLQLTALLDVKSGNIDFCLKGNKSVERGLSLSRS